MILARLLSATPNTDGEEWDLSFRLHLDEIHTTAYQQDPAPYQRGTVLGQRTGLPYPWRPSQSVWPVADAMFPGTTYAGFNLLLDLSKYPALLSAAGNTPVNTRQSVNPPQVPLTATTSNTGGQIRPGTYYIAISANANIGPVSSLISVTVPAGTNTNTVTVSGVVWPAGAATAPAAFIGVSTISLGYLGLPGLPIPYSASNPDAYGNPTTFTFGVGQGNTGLPDNLFQEFLIEASNITIPGAFMDTVTAVTGAGTAISPQVVTLASGGGWTTNQWQNRILSIYYRPGASPAVSGNVAIASSAAATLTMSDTAFGSAGFAVGDVVVMRLINATSITANTIGDAQLNLVASSQIGNQVIILSGTGANQSPKTIQSHTSGVGSVVTIQGSWDTTPDATSVWIIVGPSDAYSAGTDVIVNDGTSGLFGTVAQLPLTWVPAQSLYVTVSTCDVSGKCFPQRYQPSREIYVPAQAVASSGLNPIDTIAVIAGTATPNLSYANHYLAISADTFLAVPSNMPAGASTSWVLAVDNTDSADHSLLPDSTYSFSPALVVAAGTRAKIGWLTSQSGNTSLNFVSFNQPQTAL